MSKQDDLERLQHLTDLGDPEASRRLHRLRGRAGMLPYKEFGPPTYATALLERLEQSMLTVARGNDLFKNYDWACRVFLEQEKSLSALSGVRARYWVQSHRIMEHVEAWEVCVHWKIATEIPPEEVYKTITMMGPLEVKHTPFVFTPYIPVLTYSASTAQSFYSGYGTTHTPVVFNLRPYVVSSHSSHATTFNMSSLASLFPHND